jgi:hypothetical protein
MSDADRSEDLLARRCKRLVRVYPASYGQQRRREIVDTLMELSPDGSTFPPLGETLAVLRHGLRRRFGVATDQPLGAGIASLADQLLWFAAVLAAAGLIFAELAPWAPLRGFVLGGRVFKDRAWGFGPFFSLAAPIEITVISAAIACSLGWRRVTKLLVCGSFALTLAMVIVERTTRAWGRPPVAFIVSLLVLMLPALALPAEPGHRRRPLRRTAAALIAVEAVGLLVFCSVIALREVHQYHGASAEGIRESFFRSVVVGPLPWIPAIVGYGILVIAVATHRVSGRLDQTESPGEATPPAERASS